MCSSVEIIEFTRPDSSRKNLFITNIPGTLSEDELVLELHRQLDHYGLIYGIQVYTSQWTLKKETKNQTDANTDLGHSHYAFVSFYSSMVAMQAKEDLNSVVVLADQECKVAFAKSKKDAQEKVPLYFTRCYDLLNFYLGFGSWSTSIKMLFEDKECHTETEQTMTQKYVCLIDLTIQDVTTDGIGVWQETFIKTDPLSKIKATCKCKKLCHQRAIENAFSKVLLIVLGNGKAMVEIDTTKPDFHSDSVPEEQLVKINELDDRPESEQQDKDETDLINLSVSNMDDINLHILQELEDDM